MQTARITRPLTTVPSRARAVLGRPADPVTRRRSAVTAISSLPSPRFRPGSPAAPDHAAFNKDEQDRSDDGKDQADHRDRAGVAVVEELERLVVDEDGPRRRRLAGA